MQLSFFRRLAITTKVMLSESLVRKSSSVPSTHTAALRFRPGRVLAKKKIAIGKDSWSVVGYATAESYNLLALEEKLTLQGIYSPVPLVEDLESVCLCVKPNYQVDHETHPDERLRAVSTKDIFFFSDGSVIFWNVPHLERDTVLNFLRSSRVIEDEPFEEATILEESEMMTYACTNPETNGHTHFSKGAIKICPDQSEDNRLLEKYAFSNAIASSVKLGMLESKLDRIIDSIEFVAEDLKQGGIQMSQGEVLKKTGEIFALRHVVNLSSDLLDTPDFYWDRENLENLFHVTCAHLAIGKRTRVMNEKLTHLHDLMALLTTHLNDKHHVRLEWFIIVLIMIEVVFEVMHFAERYF